MTELPEGVLAIVRQWIERAENDIKNAEHTLLLKDDCPYDTVCFHAQQCVEKYLKAALTLRGIDFPKTHDLTELVVLLAPHINLNINVSETAALNPYAVESRYPGDWEPLGREEAIRAVQIADGIRQTIRSQLPLSVL